MQKLSQDVINQLVENAEQYLLRKPHDGGHFDEVISMTRAVAELIQVPDYYHVEAMVAPMILYRLNGVDIAIPSMTHRLTIVELSEGDKSLVIANKISELLQRAILFEPEDEYYLFAPYVLVCEMGSMEKPPTTPVCMRACVVRIKDGEAKNLVHFYVH